MLRLIVGGDKEISPVDGEVERIRSSFIIIIMLGNGTLFVIIKNHQSWRSSGRPVRNATVGGTAVAGSLPAPVEPVTEEEAGPCAAPL